VPEGKDPGNYAELGGDLQAWIEAGLPMVVPASRPGHEKILTAGSNPPGGAGPEKEGVGPQVAEIDLRDGRTMYVTNDQPTWRELAGEGKIVFSENELKRLGHACAGLDPDEAEIMKARVLDAKEVFGAAYIYRGGEAPAPRTNQPMEVTK